MAAAVRRIEQALLADPAVEHARVNLTTRRLVVSWAGGPAIADRLVQAVSALGYRAVPYDPAQLVSIMHSAPGINEPLVNHGPATYFTYRDNQRVFEGIGAWESTEVSVTGSGDPEQVEPVRAEPPAGRFEQVLEVLDGAVRVVLDVVPLRGDDDS